MAIHILQSVVVVVVLGGGGLCSSRSSRLTWFNKQDMKQVRLMTNGKKRRTLVSAVTLCASVCLVFVIQSGVGVCVCGGGYVGVFWEEVGRGFRSA